MKAAYDLHIHSALSPCGDNDMTPNNIVNMSILKGLDVIAITDHNSCANVRSIINCAQNTPLLVIPGMEVETAEEIHVVCLFPDVESAEEMQKIVYSKLPNLKNREDIFGEQLILDENDELVRKEERLLLTPSFVTINEVFEIVNKQLKGFAIPAHIDRQANSLLSTFGVIPGDIDIPCVELSDKITENSLLEKDLRQKNINIVRSSDAHYLWNIHERQWYMEIEDKSIEYILKALGKK